MNNKLFYFYISIWILVHFIYSINISYAIVLISKINLPYANELFIEGNYCYVSSGENIYVVDIKDYKHPYIVSGSDIISTNIINQLYVNTSISFVSDTNGLKIIDFSNFDNPETVSTFDISWGYTFHSSFTDNFAYIGSDYGLSIIDISDFFNPKRIAKYSGWVTKVFVDNQFAYIIDWDVFKIINIEDVNNISVLGVIDDLYIAHDSSIIVKNNYAYIVNCTGRGNAQFYIINASDKNSPVVDSFIDLTGISYARLSVYDEIAYISHYKGITLVDIKNKTNPSVLDTISIGSAENLIIIGQYYYVTNKDGLSIYINPKDNKPIALAGSNQKYVEEGATIELDASKSFSPDSSIIQYTWSQVSGIDTSISMPNAVTLSFAAPEIENAMEQLEFKLCIRDSNDLTDCDSTTIYIKRRPYDGEILFHSNCDGDYEIYEINTIGTKLNQLTMNEDNDKDAKYSKNGDKIIFIRNESEIWIMNRNGTNAKFITAGSSADFVDSEKILISKNHGSYFNNKEIFLYDTSTDTSSLITNNVSDDICIDVNNNKFAFIQKTKIGGQYNNLHISNIDGTNITQVTQFDSFDVAFPLYPHWSTDGIEIILSLSKRVDSKRALYVINFFSNKMTLFASSSSSSLDNPVWSPNGQYIVCSFNGRLLRLNLDLSEQLFLTSVNFNNSYPSDWTKIENTEQFLHYDTNCDNRINIIDVIILINTLSNNTDYEHCYGENQLSLNDLIEVLSILTH